MRLAESCLPIPAWPSPHCLQEGSCCITPHKLCAHHNSTTQAHSCRSKLTHPTWLEASQPDCIQMSRGHRTMPVHPLSSPPMAEHTTNDQLLFGRPANTPNRRFVVPTPQNPTQNATAQDRGSITPCLPTCTTTTTPDQQQAVQHLTSSRQYRKCCRWH